MQFLQPAFLWALTALAVPVLLHLFNLQRTERVVFANTRMLENLIQKTSRARKLRHLLLLFFRLMAFACIILAFAQPVFRSESFSPVGSSLSPVAVYLDDSPSMEIRDEGGTALERAIAYATSIPGYFSEKGWFRLSGNQIHSGKGWTSAAGFRDQLLDVQRSPAQKSLSTILRQQYRQFSLRNALEKKHLFILSDFQNGFLDKEAIRLLDSSVVHHFVPLAHSAASNLWIDSAWTQAESDNSGKTNLFFTLNASGLQEKRICRVQLYEGSNLQAGRQIEIQPEKRIKFGLSVRQQLHGSRSLRLEIEDPLNTTDNNFYLVLQAPSPLRVLRIGEKPNPVLQNLFRSSPQIRFQECSLLNPDFEAIEMADLLIMDKPDFLSEALSARMESRLAEGKPVCFLPGNADRKNAFWQLPLSIQIPIITTQNQVRAEGRILLPDAENSFFRNAFPDPGKNPVLPESRASLDLTSTGFPLLRFENGQVFLSRLEKGKGNIFVFAADPSEPAMSFHRHPLMLAAFYRMAESGKKSAANQLFISRTQDRIYLNTDSTLRQEEGQVELKNADVRVQAGLSKSGKQYVVQTDVAQLSAGFWEVWQNQAKLGVFALNRNPAESQMVFHAESELKAMLPQKPWIIVSPVADQANQEHLKAGMEQGWPLWKFMLLSGIVFLIAEAVLSRILARSQKSPA